MKASKYPWAAINASGVEGLGGVALVKEVAGVKIALIPVAQDTTPVCCAGAVTFAPVETASSAPRRGRRPGDGGRGADRHHQRHEADPLKAFDVILSGDDHTWGASYDGITAYVETAMDATSSRRST